MEALRIPARYLLFLLVWYGTRAASQNVYLAHGFEDSGGGTLPCVPDVEPYGDGGIPTWNRVAGLPGIETAAEGTFFWGARDVENERSGSSVARLRFEAGNICNLTSARFSFAYNVVGYDGGDDFGYELYLDGFLDHAAVLVDGSNGGGTGTDGWTRHEVPIPGTAQTAALVLYFDQNGDDVAGVDDVRVEATGDDGNCQPVCGLRLGSPRIHCLSLTPDPDALRVTIPYTGGESGVSVVSSAGTVSGDDPSQTQGGNIIITGMTEGAFELIAVRGGDCELEVPLELLPDQCQASDVVINEVLADPGHDANGDGAVNAGDEFVELYNTAGVTVDVSGLRLHDGSNSGPRFTFPAGSLLGPGESFVVFAAAGDLPTTCAYGAAAGFLGLNNDSPESVILRDPDGRVVAQMDFDDAPDGQSLTLSPDGNLSGGYYPHGAIDGNPSSVCVAGADLPVVLTDFRATALYDAVRLDWTTEAERNARLFTVERSKDGIAYDSIGSVAAGISHYVYMDLHPLPGRSLYRLRQVDVDGRANYYGPVSVRLDSGVIRLFPNPVTGRLRITGEVGPEQEVLIYHADGRPALRGWGNAIDVRRLPAGVYYLRLPRRSDASPLRFMKE